MPPEGWIDTELNDQRKCTWLRGLLKLPGFINSSGKIINAVMMVRRMVSSMQCGPQPAYRAPRMQPSGLTIHARMGLFFFFPSMGL